MKVLYYFLVVACLMGCGEPQAESNKTVNVEIGGVVFSIPEKYILSPLPSAFVPTSGLDEDTGINLKIPYSALGLESAGGIGLDSNLVVLLSPLSSFSRKTGVFSTAYNAWNGQDRFTDRIVEKEQSTGLYRIGSKAGYPTFWHYFTESPSEQVEAKETWAASCTESVPGSAICDTLIIFKNTQSDVAIAGENINRLPDIKKAYHELLASWVNKRINE